METTSKNHSSELVTVFQARRLPAMATLAGYSALIDAWGLEVPLPRTLYAIDERHRFTRGNGWCLLTPRHAPPATLAGHLTFALKYEGVDLAVLKRLFVATGPTPIEALVRDQPTGRYARRIWFLYEWLMGDRLDLLDAAQGRYIGALDPSMQWASEGEKSPRHRVIDNLPGTPGFCPLVFRTQTLEDFSARKLAERARAVVADVPRDLMARTAAFLLLSDSRSSYAIEGEHPPQDRMQRWGQAIGEAGRSALDSDELLRLQRLVIGDARFVEPGWRSRGGFVGERDRHTGAPLPAHVSARPEDLPSLVEGLIAFEHETADGFDAVIAAAILAFGFIYIHPFEDGNGRIHRYLIHHVLAQRGFNPPGVVFPVSAVILDRIDDYRAVLESYSQRLLPQIQWQPTSQQNVHVETDTADFYRYFDATPHAEFLYECVQRTIEHDLPEETTFLQCYDAFARGVNALVDMPDGTINLLFRFLRQGDGRLSRRARAREFAALTADEAARIEAIYRETLGS